MSSSSLILVSGNADNTPLVDKAYHFDEKTYPTPAEVAQTSRALKYLLHPPPSSFPESKSAIDETHSSEVQVDCNMCGTLVPSADTFQRPQTFPLQWLKLHPSCSLLDGQKMRLCSSCDDRWVALTHLRELHSAVVSNSLPSSLSPNAKSLTSIDTAAVSPSSSSVTSSSPSTTTVVEPEANSSSCGIPSTVKLLQEKFDLFWQMADSPGGPVGMIDVQFWQILHWFHLDLVTRCEELGAYVDHLVFMHPKISKFFILLACIICVI